MGWGGGRKLFLEHVVCAWVCVRGGGGGESEVEVWRAFTAILSALVLLMYFVVTFSDVVPLLFRVINAEESRSRENVNATENAISAVAKICKYSRGNIALNEVIPAFLATLPITEDKEEAPHVYGYLCDLIEE